MLQYLVLLNAFISYHCTEITDESQCNSNEETQIGCAEGHPIYIVKLVANSEFRLLVNCSIDTASCALSCS